MIILFVDEDAKSRQEVKQLLGRYALLLTEYDSVAQAIQDLPDLHDCRLLIVEAVQRSGLGFELRDAFLKEFPNTPVLFTSRFDLSDYANELKDTPVYYAPLDHTFTNAIKTLIPEDQVEWSRAARSLKPSLSAGDQMGDYLIRECLCITGSEEYYSAYQSSVKREVELIVMRPGKNPAEIEEKSKQFQTLIKVQAAVNHPRIASVFEFSELNDHLFYTREPLVGRSLQDYLEKGEKVPQKEFFQAVSHLAEAIHNLTTHNTPRRIPTLKEIFIDTHGEVRLANTADPTSSPIPEPVEVRTLAESLQAVAERGKPYHFLTNIIRGGEHTWEELGRLAAEQAIRLQGESSLSRTEKELDSKALQQGKGRIFLFLILLVLIILGWVIYKKVTGLPTPPPERPLQESMSVRTGPFIFQENESVTLSRFQIDKFEVTIAEYAKFLQAIEEETGDANSAQTPWNHERQPATKVTHKPADWDQYYERAKVGGLYKGRPIEVNCPVFSVDWWSAFAYAKWKNRRLPTEQEWEKAARGEKGFLYPWGNEANPQSANFGDDYPKEEGEAGGLTDGYAYWAPVDAFEHDISEFGVSGTAGNLEEWTDTWVDHPTLPDAKTPLVKGGSFAVPSSQNLLHRRLANDPSEQLPFRGFRTVGD